MPLTLNVEESKWVSWYVDDRQLVDVLGVSYFFSNYNWNDKVECTGLVQLQQWLQGCLQFRRNGGPSRRKLGGNKSFKI